VSDESLGNIKERAEACQRCPCAQSRRRVVIYRGMVEPRILFVGQSPGPREDELGVPFVGPAGSLLDEAFGIYHVDSYGVINIINCFPPNNKFQESFGIACQPFLVDKLKVFLPGARYLVTLGRDAEKAIWEVQRLYPGLFQHLTLHHIIHPAAVLRNPGWRSKWDGDWREFARKVHESS